MKPMENKNIKDSKKSFMEFCHSFYGNADDLYPSFNINNMRGIMEKNGLIERKLIFLSFEISSPKLIKKYEDKIKNEITKGFDMAAGKGEYFIAYDTHNEHSYKAMSESVEKLKKEYKDFLDSYYTTD